MNFGAPEEIFTDGGKNLWGGVVQKYLERIKMVRKSTSPYHPRTSEKVESLNGLIGSMLTKYLFGKPTRLWDLYLDQALFAYRIRTQATTKTSHYYLGYGQRLRLVGGNNYPLLGAPVENCRSRIELVRSVIRKRQDHTNEPYARRKRGMNW